MLVLSRMKDESIMLGDDIEITILDIRSNKVRIGIAAPKEMSVDRSEVRDAKKLKRKVYGAIQEGEQCSAIGPDAQKKLA